MKKLHQGNSSSAQQFLPYFFSRLFFFFFWCMGQREARLHFSQASPKKQATRKPGEKNDGKNPPKDELPHSNFNIENVPFSDKNPYRTF